MRQTLLSSFAQTTYSAQGILETQQETIIATRNGRVVQENVSESSRLFRDPISTAEGDDAGDGGVPS